MAQGLKFERLDSQLAPSIEIPTLLALVPASQAENNEATTARGLLHPREAGSDDGLGAFRPSTSFNDLTTFLPPSASVNNSKSPLIMTAVSSTTISAKQTETKKRGNGNSLADGPSAKRRASGSRKNAGTPKAKSKAVSNNKTVKGAPIGKQGTPNPLTARAQVAVPAPGGIKPHPIKPVAKPSTVPSATPSSRFLGKTEPNDSLPPAPTEADFKSVAQAAVSNLIANAGNRSENSNKPACVTNEESLETIDTSTEHIKALTGSNWVTVCSDGQSCNSAADKMNNRARRQNLTPDERARQNRDRNREHARNTRLRKKAYVDELKRTLTALVSQRDAAEVEKRHSAQRELEQREVRFRVVEEFLKLRGRNESNYARWAAILEDSFTMTLPNTDYREIAADRGQYEQSLSGVSQVMSDSSMFAGFLQSLAKVSSGHQISFVYNCDRKNFLMDNCTAVLYWTATSNGAIHQVLFVRSIRLAQVFKLRSHFFSPFSLLYRAHLLNYPFEETLLPSSAPLPTSSYPLL
jgi:hypothetical protein